MVGNMLTDARKLVLMGEFEQARAHCEKILERDPNDAGALFQLGSIFLLEKNYVKSRRYLEKALDSNPENADALNNLGTVLQENDRDFDAAEKCFLGALGVDPLHFNALMNLGNTYGAMGRLKDAARCYRDALKIDPGNGILLNNLGALCTKCNDRDGAIEYYQKAAGLLPQDPEVLANLLTSLKATRKKDEILALMPLVANMPKPGAYLFPAFCFAKGYCLWDEADSALQGSLALVEDGCATFQNFEELNLPLLAVAGLDSINLSKIHKAAGNAIERMRTAAPFSDHGKAMEPSRRWRVGYISPDFKDHVVNYFFRGLINSHDRDAFEVYCYSNTWSEDEITEQYRAAADVFVRIADMSDEKLAKRIHDDGIHFLVDLAGYTSDSRLRIMSYRPAPVQISYIGYPFTSGLSAVDYIIVDPYIMSPKNAELFTEEQLCLPETYYAFESLKEQAIDPVNPHVRNNHVTFGCLINLYKISRNLVRVWSEILRRVPGSRIMLNHPNFEIEVSRKNVLEEFAANGIEEGRIDIVWQKHPDQCYLRYYNDIDIVLDSFPMTGGTTSVDAVWMGKPLVTLVGEVFHQRITYSVLSNIGIRVDDLIAFCEEEYVEKAVALAHNPGRIDELHGLIPANLKESTLCNPARFTRQIEAAFVEGWKRKFSVCPVVEPQKKMEFVPLRDGVEIAAVGTLDDEDTYILKEQQGWFDPEYEFVMQAIVEGDRVVDIGAGIGCYSVPIARMVGESGMVWATVKTAREEACLQMSRRQNRLHGLRIITCDNRLIRDRDIKWKDRQGVDFVRVHLDTAQRKTLNDVEELFVKSSPLVMFGIRRGNRDIDTGFATFFKERGYDIYRFVPGLSLMVPFGSDDDLDAFSINLFACRPDRARLLEDRWRLIREVVAARDLPGIHVRWWQDYLDEFPYASSFLVRWPESIRNHGEWEAYWVSLNLFAAAKDSSRQAYERHAAMLASYNVLLMLAQASPTLPRLISFCRVLAELGKRETAVNILNQLTSLLDGGVNMTVDEPFLPLSEEYAAMDPEGRIAEWLVASILERREMLRAFSSYFTGQESLPVLEEIRATGFCTQEVKRRIALIKSRFNIQP